MSIIISLMLASMVVHILLQFLSEKFHMYFIMPKNYCNSFYYLGGISVSFLQSSCILSLSGYHFPKEQYLGATEMILIFI